MSRKKNRLIYEFSGNFIGVYGLKFRETVIYVGSSKVSVANRGSHHSVKFNYGNHSPKLQKLWDENNGEGFSIFKIEECGKENCREREIYWSSVYDETLLSEHPAHKKFKMSEQTRSLMKEHAIRVSLDPEERKKRSERAKRQHAQGIFGRQTWSEEAKRSQAEKTGNRPNNGAHLKDHIAQQSSEEMSRRSYCREIFKNKAEI